MDSFNNFIDQNINQLIEEIAGRLIGSETCC